MYLTTPNAKYWGRTDLYKSIKEIPDVNPHTEIRDAHIWQYNITELLDVLNLAGLEVLELDYSNEGKQFNLALRKKRI